MQNNSQLSTLNSQLALMLALTLLVSCANKPAPAFNVPPPNPDAPLAFFGEGNMKQKMRMEYATALQNAGFFNFVLNDFSDEQVEEGVEIRLNYSKEKKTHILEAKFVKDNLAWFNLTIKEKDEQILLNYFLQEVKRLKE